MKIAFAFCYITGHTSVQMCERLMGNLDLLGSARRAYHQPFNFHQTVKHKEQSSFPDVIKGMWFCLANRIFQHSPGRIAIEYPLSNLPGEQKTVPKYCLDVVKNGEKKVTDKFEAKLHESFPSFRQMSLERMQQSSDDESSENE